MTFFSAQIVELSGYVLRLFEATGCGELIPGRTGTRIWSSSALLAEHMISKRDEVEGRSVLELGAGPGVCGLLAVHLGSSNVLMTDFDPKVLTLLMKNIRANFLETDACDRVHTHRLDWEDESTYVSEQFDVLIASDVLYWEEHIGWLVRTISFHLKPAGTCMMVVAGRGKPTLVAGLVAALSNAGFHVVQSHLDRTAVSENLAQTESHDAQIALTGGYQLIEARRC
jgi:predicted nicotinamide N-methyase